MPSIAYASSARTRLLYQDVESERTYEVERANIRTSSNPFLTALDDWGIPQYAPVNYSIRGDLRISLPVGPHICADIHPGRRGLFASISSTGQQFTVPVTIQEVQANFFNRVEFTFVATGPLTQSVNPPVNPEPVRRRSEVLAQQYLTGQISRDQFREELRRPNDELNAPAEPPKPPRRRRLRLPVDVPIEA